MKKKIYRKRIGDILEIKTAKGLSYAQYTHNNDLMGSLIRVFKTIFQERPESFKKLVQGDIQFMTFFPVTQAVNQQCITFVGHEEVPEHAKSFPIFKSNNGVAADGYTYWWLWDGEKSWQIGIHLTEEQKHYPRRFGVNDTALIEMIEEGWTHESEC